MEKKNNVLGQIKVERETFEKDGKSFSLTSLKAIFVEKM